VLAALDHVNIVRYLDCFTAERGRIQIVMELCAARAAPCTVSPHCVVFALLHCCIVQSVRAAARVSRSALGPGRGAGPGGHSAVAHVSGPMLASQGPAHVRVGGRERCRPVSMTSSRREGAPGGQLLERSNSHKCESSGFPSTRSRPGTGKRRSAHAGGRPAQLPQAARRAAAGRG